MEILATLLAFMTLAYIWILLPDVTYGLEPVAETSDMSGGRSRH